jgi:hypothetical protein
MWRIGRSLNLFNMMSYLNSYKGTWVLWATPMTFGGRPEKQIRGRMS